MKGNAQVLQILNDVLVGELTAVNQYFLGAKIAGQRGYERLAHKVHKESLDEMRHAEKLIDRILFLEGLPNLQKLEKVKIAESVTEQLKADLESEARSVERLNAGIKVSREAGDHGSADLLEALLESSEKHLDWLETQVGLVKSLGDTHYLAQQLKKDG
jgi:bacterioferritin